MTLHGHHGSYEVRDSYGERITDIGRMGGVWWARLRLADWQKTGKSTSHWFQNAMGSRKIAFEWVCKQWPIANI